MLSAEVCLFKPHQNKNNEVILIAIYVLHCIEVRTKNRLHNKIIIYINFTYSKIAIHWNLILASFFKDSYSTPNRVSESTGDNLKSGYKVPHMIINTTPDGFHEKRSDEYMRMK